MPIEPEPKWATAPGRAPLEDDIDPARQGIFASNLPSVVAARDRRTEYYPRGWTVQQPWMHPEFPRPAVTLCTMCAEIHELGACEVTRMLVAHGLSARP